MQDRVAQRFDAGERRRVVGAADRLQNQRERAERRPPPAPSASAAAGPLTTPNAIGREVLLEQRAGIVIERLRRAAEPAGRFGQARGVEAVLGQRRHQLRACARDRSADRRCSDRRRSRSPLSAAIFCKRGARNVEQRPRQDDPVELLLLAHGGEPVDPRAARQPQQKRLGLIVLVMRGHDRVEAGLAAAVGEAVVARAPRPVLQVAGLAARRRCMIRAGKPEPRGVLARPAAPRLPPPA